MGAELAALAGAIRVAGRASSRASTSLSGGDSTACCKYAPAMPARRFLIT